MKKVNGWMIALSIMTIVNIVCCLVYHCQTIRNIFTSDWIWTMIGSVATSVSVISAYIIYRKSTNIDIKQKTYEAMYKLKDDVYEIERRIGELGSAGIDRLVENRKKGLNLETKKTSFFSIQIKKRDVYIASNKQSSDYKNWEDITKYLTKLEHFATCVNDKIFDIETVRKMSGDYLIRQNTILQPIILHKISENKGGDTYKQFRKMVKKLDK